MKKVALCAIASSFLVLATAAKRTRHTTALGILCSSRDPVHAMQPTILRSISPTGSSRIPTSLSLGGMSPDRVQFARPLLFRINTRRAQAGFRVIQAMAAGAGAPVGRCAQAIGRRRGIDGWSQDEFRTRAPGEN